jgi:hypothetical protein
LQSPTNQRCHNLCQNIQPPPGFNYLLGLGLNFCIETLNPKPNINRTIERLQKSIRLKHWMRENNTITNDDYIPSLYVPTTWKPPEAPTAIETAIKSFSLELEKTIRANKTKACTNRTKLQYHCLHSIKNDHRLIVCMSDKNLGPVLMERDTYIHRCLHEHLLCQRTYVRLTEVEALQKLQSTRRILNETRLHHRTDLSDAENTYFKCAAKLAYCIPQFYPTIKIHKQPWKTLPIVSCINSYLNVFSKW